jgi:enoyl-CoA hydratase/carnithine racemase
MSDLIRSEAREQVAWITIYRPDKRNAMTRAMLYDFAAAVDAADRDPEARVVVVTGAGGAFVPAPT